MASGNISRVIRGQGRIVINPVNLNAVYPHGGTEVGKTNLCVLAVLGQTLRIDCEGLGEATDVLTRNNQYVFSCFLRGWDDDAVEQLLKPNYVKGAVSGHAVYQEPGAKAPGESSLDRSVILLYVPDDLIHVPAMLIYRGIPNWSDGSEFAFQREDEEIGLPLAVDCLRDDDDKILKIGRFADLVPSLS